MHLQESGEMYLETIHILSQRGKGVRAVDVAEHMGFSKPSVSRAVGLLRSGGYLELDENGFLVLTEEAAPLPDGLFCLSRRRPGGGRAGRLQDRARHQRGDLPGHEAPLPERAAD